MRAGRVAALSLAVTALFFFEYLPGAKRVQLHSDIEGYHHPLYTYAHRAIQEGRMPEWDWSLYCGIPYLANPQTAFFYPPNWLLHWVNRKHEFGVRYWTVEALAFLHFSIAFFTAWLWLRHRARSDSGGIAGAAVFAFGGYMTGEVQHLGAICAYAWFPLGLHGVDRRSLPQVAIASALCWLAGYPSMWIVFCACVTVYALASGGWRHLAWTCAGLAASAGLFAIQLAPALEAAANKVKDTAFGGGWPGGWFFAINFLLPNYYDHSSRAAQYAPMEEQYLYIGAVALAAICFARQQSAWRPALAIAAVCLFLAKDPLGVLHVAVPHSATLNDVLREWNFLAAMFVPFAILTASGVAGIESRPARLPAWVALLAVAWAGRQLWVWNHGAFFATGWLSAVEVGITAALGVALLRSPRSRFATAAFILLLFADYKVYGTSRRFNAVPGARDIDFQKDVRTGGKEFLAMADSDYRTLLANRHYRLIFADVEWANEVRHYGLLSPQGADPLVPPAFKQAVEQLVPFSTNRLFPLDWRKPEHLDAFGIRYLISNKMLEAPHLRPLPGTGDNYHKVFEFIHARPAYRYESGTARPTHWSPEHRAFDVDSRSGGAFLLIENLASGWTATIDGQPAPIAHANIAFQRIDVPPGRHTVEFRYRSQALRIGAVITGLSMAALAVLAARRRLTSPWKLATAVTILM